MRGGEIMKCPRCGGDMSSGVCEECGFPVNKIIQYKRFIIVYKNKTSYASRYRR